MGKPRACWLLWLLLAACSPQPSAGSEAGEGRAVILLYHHVAEDTPSSTSVAPALFEAHLDHLADQGYRVLRLSRIIAALREGTPLPARSVAITFDDAYLSVYSTAAPRLAERGWPYAVFVSTDFPDASYQGYMTWAQLREIEAEGAEIGNHSRSHDHYVHRRPGEDQASWRQRVSEDIRWAQRRLREELQHPLEALAYPYGEFDPASADLVRDLGLTGFGQQSGPVDHRSDLSALPRFPMAAGFAGLESLAEKLRTRPLHATVLAPASRILAADAAAPALRLRLETPGLSAAQARSALRCYVTGQPQPDVRWIDADAGVLEVQAIQPLAVGRSKYTCTAPVAGSPGSFYWYSHLWMKPPAPGRWYDG